jgi:hypothetical protein
MDNLEEIAKEMNKDLTSNEMVINTPISVGVDFTNAFKNLGTGAAAAGIGVGAAKILKTLPPNTIPIGLIGAGIISSASVITSVVSSIYDSKDTSNMNLRKSINSSVPKVTGEIKIGECTKISIDTATEAASLSDITEIPSIFESFYDTSNSYIILLYCTLFISCLGLYTLIALNIGYILNKGAQNLVSKIQNPILLKIINFYTKYNTALFWFWFFALYYCFIALIIISLVLINQYPLLNL